LCNQVTHQVTDPFGKQGCLLLGSPKTCSCINVCDRKQSLQFQAQMSNGLTWAIVQILKKTFTLLMQQCVHKQLYGYWLLYDALNVEISINIKLQDEYRCRTKV